MDTNRANMNMFFQNINLRFKNGFGRAPSNWQRYCDIVPGTGAQTIFPFLEQNGGMTEWIGDRQISRLTSDKLTIVPRKFSAAIAIPRDDIEDDQYDIYGNKIEELGFNSDKIWDDLVEELLTVRAATAKWADGAAFFGTTRKYGKNVIANKGTAVLSSTSYKAARVAMREFKGHNGKALGVTPNLLLCGPGNEDVAFDILKNELLVKSGEGGSIKNVWYNTADVLILNELAGDYANYWFLLDITKTLKPIAVLQRKQPTLVRKDQDTDDNVFDRDEYVYGTSARGEAALVLPHLIYGGLAAA